jgi:hypothetical protein
VEVAAQAAAVFMDKGLVMPLAGSQAGRLVVRLAPHLVNIGMHN